MIKLDEKEYIYKVRSKLRLLSAYYILISMLFSLIYSYYFFKGLEIPDVIIYSNLAIIIIFTIITIQKAEYIKRYANKYNIDLFSDKYIKVFDKLLFVILIINLSYNLISVFLQKNINYKMDIKSILTLILFTVLWLNYRFLY
jgi:hypothetical protein